MNLEAALQGTWVVTLGLVLGSFANVVIARLPEGQSVVRPGSRCPGCGRPIRWFENVPVLSYLALRARCPGCKMTISPRYPLVEILTALLFYACWVRFGFDPALFVRHLPYVFLLVCITFIDLDVRLIPDKLSLPGLALGLGTSWMTDQPGLMGSIVGAAFGFGFFYSVAWLYSRMRGKMGLGGGDIKLLAMMGAFSGASGVFTIILLSSILGSVLGLIWAFVQKRKQGNDEEGMLSLSIPYGPFLVVGGLYQYLLGDLVWLPFT